MNRNSWTWLILFCCTLLLLSVFIGCGDDDDDDDEYPTCERDTELVFDAQFNFESEERFFRYWLDENEDDFLSGWVRDLTTAAEYPAYGKTKGKNSYLLTFSPGTEYENYSCDTSLSLTLDLKNLEGTLTVYCELEKMDQLPATAEILCDETGITLDNS